MVSSVKLSNRLAAGFSPNQGTPRQWLTRDAGARESQERNNRSGQTAPLGVGLASAAAPFLPVFLTRLEATSTQVGLLSSMPGVTGLLLAIPIGRFLQSRKYIVPGI